MADPDLAALIRPHRARINDVFDAIDSGTATEADLEDPPGTSFRCGFDVILADEDDEPRVEILAGIDPGGTVREARSVATSGDASVSEEVEYGGGLHRAMEAWFTRFWDSSDEAPDVPRAEVLITRRRGDFAGRRALPRRPGGRRGSGGRHELRR